MDSRFSNKNSKMNNETQTYADPKLYKPNQAIYEGKRLHGLKHGRGKLKWGDGSLYTGDFAQGKREGYGKLITPKETYTGHWKDDQKQGVGILNFDNGDFFRGHFKQNRKHGFGICKKENMFVTGFWQMGKKQGDFFGFCINRGLAFDIKFKNDFVEKVSQVVPDDYPNQPFGRDFDLPWVSSDELKKILCCRIQEIEKLIKMPGLSILEKRSSESFQKIHGKNRIRKSSKVFGGSIIFFIIFLKLLLRI